MPFMWKTVASKGSARATRTAPAFSVMNNRPSGVNSCAVGTVSPRVHTLCSKPGGSEVSPAETPKIENGQLVVPDKPGLGLAFDQAAIKRYQVG